MQIVSADNYYGMRRSINLTIIIIYDIWHELTYYDQNAMKPNAATR